MFVAGICTSGAIFYNFSFFELDDRSFDVSAVPTVDVENLTSFFVDGAQKVVAQTTSAAESQNLHVADIAKLNSPLDRSTELHSELREADEDYVLKLLEQSKQLDAPARLQVQAICLQRLVRVNPLLALTQAAKFNQSDTDDLWSALFSEWAQIDLNESVSHATALDSTERQAALEGILRERTYLTDKERRQIALQLGNEQYAINLITMEELSESNAEPEVIWNQIIEEAQNDSKQIEVLVQVAQFWVEKQGLEALDLIFASLDNERTRAQISIAVFRELALVNPSAAFKHSLRLDSSLYSHSTVIVVEEWAKTDPQSAFDAVLSMWEIDSHRAKYSKLVETLATSKPRSILENVASIPKFEVKQATKTALSALASTSPLDAAAWVSTCNEDSLMVELGVLVIDQWVVQDLDATLDWVLTDPGLDFPRTRLLGYVLKKLAEDDLDRAMRIALAYPTVENEWGPEYLIIHSLSQSDIEKAIEYIPKLRDGSTKRDAYRRVGFELVNLGMTDKALELLQEIPEYAKQPYLDQVFDFWAYKDRTGLFEALDHMPSTAIASSASLKLLLRDPWCVDVNSQQREALLDRLTNEDAKQLKRRSLKTDKVH